METAQPKDHVSVNNIALTTSNSGTQVAAHNLGEVLRFADMMSRTAIGIPKHLRGNPGACAAVCMQSLQWGFNPFAVASKTYLVGDAIAYEAQLIAAVINTRAGLKRRLQITYAGEGQGRKCIVTGEFADGSVHVVESPALAMIKPQNSPLWKSDPDQQLAYYTTRSFGRRHCPEVIMGVYDREELEPLAVHPSDVVDITTQLRQRAAQPQLQADQVAPQSPQQDQQPE